MWRPSACSFFSTTFAIVDLPEPDRPVNHTTHGLCPLSAACACLLTSIACQWMFCERRSAKCSRPAPIVLLVSRSIRMKPPVSRFSAYESNAIGWSRLRLQTPISF